MAPQLVSHHGSRCEYGRLPTSKAQGKQLPTIISLNLSALARTWWHAVFVGALPTLAHGVDAAAGSVAEPPPSLTHYRCCICDSDREATMDSANAVKAAAAEGRGRVEARFDPPWQPRCGSRSGRRGARSEPEDRAPSPCRSPGGSVQGNARCGMSSNNPP
jgi:hypothetical protein